MVRSEVNASLSEVTGFLGTRDRTKGAASKTDVRQIARRGKPSKIGNFPIFTQSDRAADTGITDRTQRKLDYLVRLADQSFIDRVRSGELSADRAYRLARGIPDKISIEKTPEGFAFAARNHLTRDQITHNRRYGSNAAGSDG
jgi:hypothetical protein